MDSTKTKQDIIQKIWIFSCLIYLLCLGTLCVKKTTEFHSHISGKDKNNDGTTYHNNIRDGTKYFYCARIPIIFLSYITSCDD